MVPTAAILLVIGILGFMVALIALNPERGRGSSAEWSQGHGYRLVISLIVVSIITAFIARVGTTGYWRVMLEFVLGGWPNHQYYDTTADQIKNSDWLAVGVFLQTLVTVGFPVALVAYIRRLLQRRDVMKLRDFIGQRDAFMEAQVSLALMQHAHEDLTEEQFYEIVATAIGAASEQWEGRLSPQTREQLNEAWITVAQDLDHGMSATAFGDD